MNKWKGGHEKARTLGHDLSSLSLRTLWTRLNLLVAGFGHMKRPGCPLFQLFPQFSQWLWLMCGSARQMVLCGNRWGSLAGFSLNCSPTEWQANFCSKECCFKAPSGRVACQIANTLILWPPPLPSGSALFLLSVCFMRCVENGQRQVMVTACWRCWSRPWKGLSV